MTESRFKCAVVRYLRKELPGAYVYHPSDKFVSGVPDLFILWKGKFTAIELKVGRNTVTDIQIATLRKICKAGGNALVCREMGQVIVIVEKMKEAA